MSVTKAVKTGGRKLGTRNKPKPQLATPAAAAAAARGRRGGAGGAAVLNNTPQARGRAKGGTVRKIKMVRTADLVAHPGNARTHDAVQITDLAASIREYGWTSPILTDGHLGILAGHGRLAAARQLGMVMVETLSLNHLTDAQQRAYVIADNQLALAAGWDEGLLIEGLEGLKLDNYDLSLLGFDARELKNLLDDPEPPAAPRQKTAVTTMATCPNCSHEFKI